MNARVFRGWENRQERGGEKKERVPHCPIWRTGRRRSDDHSCARMPERREERKKTRAHRGRKNKVLNPDNLEGLAVSVSLEVRLAPEKRFSFPISCSTGHTRLRPPTDRGGMHWSKLAGFSRRPAGTKKKYIYIKTRTRTKLRRHAPKN